LCQIYGKFLT